MHKGTKVRRRSTHDNGSASFKFLLKFRQERDDSLNLTSGQRNLGLQIINNSLLEPFPIFVLIAAIYFAICYPLSRLSRKLEARAGFAPAAP